MSGSKCLVVLCILQFVHAAIINSTANSKTRVTMTTTPKPPPDVSRWHGMYFWYHKWSLEHLLLLVNEPDCYLMPLSDQDVEDILNPQKLHLMEEHMISQIGQHNFVTWTYDDYEVRDKSWADICRKKVNGTIYRVYRL